MKTLVSCLFIADCQGAPKNSPPKVFFAVFSATAWSFNVKFYRFIYNFVLHISVKLNAIILKNGKVIDLLMRPITIFPALSMLCYNTVIQ